MIPVPTREELVEQYHSENMTFKQIAESYKDTVHEASKETVRSWFDILEIEWKKKPWMLWSKAELKTLHELYLKHPKKELLDALPNRTLAAIETKAHELKLKRIRKKRPNWTVEEYKILHEVYPTKSKDEILKALPDRNWRAIKHRACKLKIKRDTKGPKCHWGWKGGRHKIKAGYIDCYRPDHPHTHDGKYVREHILVWEQFHGRALPKGYIIHHLNGIRDDNRPENLVAVPRRQHECRTVPKLLQKRIRELEETIFSLNSLICVMSTQRREAESRIYG